MIWSFICGWSIRLRSGLVHEGTFEATICSETAVGPVALSPLNSIVCLVVAWIVGVTFDVYEDYTT